MYGFVAVVSAIIASGATWLTLLLNRKKPAADIHESQTRSDLNLAQAENLRLQGQLNAGDMISRILTQLFEAQEHARCLTEELEAAKREVSRLPAMEAELKTLSLQVARARAAGFLAEDPKPYSEGGAPNPAA